MNKTHIFISFLIVGLSLATCTKQPKESTFSKLKKSHFDFTEWKKISYQDLDFQIPTAFKSAYLDDHVLSEDALSKSIIELGVHFTVEAYDAVNFDEIYVDFEDDYSEIMENAMDSLTTLHQNFVMHRTESLKFYDFSLLEIYKQKKAYPTLIQVVQGSPNAYSEELFYMIASLKKGNKFYIFQFISNEDFCNYLHDDFIKILNSVR